jgi:hypothetical protein
MEEKKMTKRIIVGALLGLAIVATANPVKHESIRANAQQEEPVGAPVRGRNLTLFGLIGLSRGQTARLNVVNLRIAPVVEPVADQLINLVPCTVRFRFLDQRGNTITRSIENILPGNGAFLDLAFHEAVPRGFDGKRVQIRAIVRTLNAPDDERRGCTTLATLEIFDNETGRTSVIYPEISR